MQLLHVATRKGLFALRRAASGWRIGQPQFPGEPVTQVAADAQGNWYAALRLGHFGVKLKRSADGGASWQDIAAPAFPPKPAEPPWNEDPTPWTVDMVWSLEVGGGTLWAGALPAGLFRSTDRGENWQLVDSLWRRPSACTGSVGVRPCRHPFDPGRSRDPQHVTLAVSCAACADARCGATWANTSDGFDAGAYMPPERRHDGNVQDVHRLSACAAQPDVIWAQHHGGLYRCDDGGLHWRPLAAPAPSAFGFAVAAHPRDPLRAWFVPAHSDQQRMPVDGRLVVNETRDGGASFRSHGEGLPARDAYHLVYRHALACADDGETLAMGSTTGGLWISGDGGANWECVSRDLPPIAAVRWV